MSNRDRRRDLVLEALEVFLFGVALAATATGLALAAVQAARLIGVAP